jgi:hypothetical protein
VKAPDERRRHTYTVVAIVGGGGLVLFLLVRGAEARAGSPARARSSARTRSAGAQPSRHSLNFAPNPANPSLEEAMIQARTAALGIFDQSAVAEQSSEQQYQLGLNQDKVAQAIAFNTNATQLKETGLTTTAQQAIAETEAQAQEQAAQEQASVESQYAQAQQTQSQGSWWSSLLGGIGSILPFLGFSPTGAGVGYVDSSGMPSLPPSYDLPGGDPYAALGIDPGLPPAYVPPYVGIGG